MRKLIVLLALLPFCTATAGYADRTLIRFPDGISESASHLLVRANVQLLKHCPALFPYWGDVSRAYAEIFTAPDGADYDWKKIVRYTISVQPRRKRKFIPETEDTVRGLNAGGYQIVLRGKPLPGILVESRGSQVLCGFTPQEVPVFIPVPDLAFIDQIEPGDWTVTP